MIFADNLPNEPEEDKPRRELVDITEIERALAKNNNIQSTIAMQEKMLGTTLAPQQEYDRVVKELSRINQMTQSFVPSPLSFEKVIKEFNHPVSQSMMRAAEAYTRYDRIISNAANAASVSSTLSRFEKEICQTNQIFSFIERSAAHDYAGGMYKSLLNSQLSMRPQIETYRNALYSAYPNILSNQDIPWNKANEILRKLDTDIRGGLFQDSCLKTIQTISESFSPSTGFLAESIQQVLDRQNDAVRKASLLAAQVLSKDLLTNAQAIFDYKQFSLEADLIKKAISPLVREWGWLVCEAKLVSVDISHDGDHLLYAEYDRETVLELLTAKFALEETQPEVLISSSGELEHSPELLECSGEHSSHSAHYRGETILDSEDKESKKKSLWQCLAELRQQGLFDEETWDQIEIDAKRAEMYVREIFGDVMHIAMLFALELAALYVKENPLSAEEFRAHQEKAFARLRKLLPKPDEGRPKGTGLFRDEDDFLTALKDVLQKASKKLSQREALHAIRQHPLCQKKTSAFPSQNETKTFRNWLDRCDLKYKDALEIYWQSPKKGK